jgi:hypothetical protein
MAASEAAATAEAAAIPELAVITEVAAAAAIDEHPREAQVMIKGSCLCGGVRFQIDRIAGPF